MTLPAEMNAVEITSPGEPGVLKLGKRPMPTIANEEVLIEVAAAGVNRPDVLQRKGMYEPPPGTSDIPGLEIAGRVAAAGPAGKGVKGGDPGCAPVAGGGHPRNFAAPQPPGPPVS